MTAINASGPEKHEKTIFNIDLPKYSFFGLLLEPTTLFKHV